MTPLTDSHCHLDSAEFDHDREKAVERALEAGVTRLLAIGTGEGPPDLEAGLRLADRYPHLQATVGVHPHNAARAKPEIYKHLADLLRHPKIVAMGEIGLDYHYDFAPRASQQEVFIRQMEVAAEARKPIIIHTREAWDDTFALLEKHWAASGLSGIMHCFSGGPAEAGRSLGLGFYLSFAGILTFPKAVGVHAAAREAPADRILIETDSPYLAPVPRRGKRNEPAFVAYTAAKLAELRGISVDEVSALTNGNYERLLLLH